ncbi:MAG: cache domain-containing protein [Fibrobacteria bacterium]|nr:cache domain-containing protein [Fibrobacteria bacterium]
MILRTLVAFVMCFGMVVSAAETTEKEKAVALVAKAADLMTKEGREKALTEISKADGPFVAGELYVFAYDLEGVIVAHPKNSKLIGKNMLKVPDVDGKMFREEIVELAKTKGTGWVDYKYKNATSGKVEEKTTWIRKVGDVVLCCGVYR